MVGRPARRRRRHPRKPQGGKVQLVDEDSITRTGFSSPT
jgi:hypothetical protein